MFKLLLPLAFLAVAHTLPIEQNEEDKVSLPDSAAVEIESSIVNPESDKHEESVVIEPIDGTVPAEIESSIFNSESDKHEEPIVTEPIDGTVPPEIQTSIFNSEHDKHEKPVVTEAIDGSIPAVIETSIFNPESDKHEEPVVTEPVVTVPAEIETSIFNSESNKHKEPEVKEPTDGIFTTEITTPSLAPGKHEKDDEVSDEELEAALDEFFKFLNLTDSEEMENVVVEAILREMFEGLDEILTAFEQMAEVSGQQENSQILLKHVNDMNIFGTLEGVKSPKLLTTINDQEQLNQESEVTNEDDSPAASCKTAKGLPGVCVPYYLCDTTSDPDPDENDIVIPLDVDTDSCPFVIAVCCSSEHLQLGTGAGLRKSK